MQSGKDVLIIGAGMAGLSTAWHLQEHGYRPTVIDAVGVAGGSSWGNAGWVSPALTLPLNEPALLRVGIKATLTPSSPVYVPPTASPRLLSFLARFAANCTPEKWRRALRLYIDANREAVGAFEQLVAGGVRAELHTADPFVAAFTTDSDRDTLVHEMETVNSFGGDVVFKELDGAEVRAVQPVLADTVTSGLALEGQRFINPGAFVDALAADVRRRGGEIREGAQLGALSQRPGGGVDARLSTGERLRPDLAVLATGAWLTDHARKLGVRRIVQAGRGYSFSVVPAQMPVNPVYFPAQRVACTPLGDRLRVAGMMEFRKPDAPLDPRRVRAIIDAARPLLTGIDWDARTEEWVGSRPATPDGLPLVGRTKAPDVFVNGGHGMWGIALGPLSGRLLAELIATGRQPAMLRGFDPLR